MIFFAVRRLLSVVGEVDPGKEIGNESEIALEITEETESETEAVIEKEREKEYVIGTETGGREAAIEDNVLLEALIGDKNIVFLCVCLQVVNVFSAVCLNTIM